MYRPEIKVVDCTIRDGGLMNKWEFPKPMVKEVFQGLVDAGVDYVELGYRADKKEFSPKDFGPWRFCDEADLRDVAYECEGTKISVMVDVGRTDYDNFLPKSESIVSMFRVATYAKEVDKAIHLANHIRALGYEVCINIMAASVLIEADIEEALNTLKGGDFRAVYLVDSFGYFFQDQIDDLADKYIGTLSPIDIGIHCHNNQQLAFANTVQGIIKGINFVDGSIYGMGRAAGNCPTECLLGFLKNPKFDIRPVLGLIEKHFVKMKDDLRWGYEIPYLVSGILNRHPRGSLKYMDDMVKGTEQRSFIDFYNEQAGIDLLD